MAQGQLHQRRVQDAVAVVFRGELQRLHLAAQQLVQRLHRHALGVGQRPDVAGDLVGDDVLGADDAAQPRLLHQIHVVGAGHLGQYLFHPGAACRQRHQQVLLVPPCQRHEAVGAEQVLRSDHVVVRAVALDDHGVRQLLGQAQALVMILLHNVYPCAGSRQLPAQVHADAAAAQNGHVLHPLQAAPHVLEHLVQLRLAAHHIQPVVRLRHKGAVGDEELVAPLRRADQHLRHPLPVEVAEGAAEDGVVRVHLEADHVDAPAGKRLHGDGRREAEDPRDLLRRRQIGVDDHVQPDLPLEHVRVPAVFRVPHPGDGVLRAHAFGDQAAHQIRLVHAGDGDDQIGLPRPGLHQHADGRAVAVDAHGVQRVVRPAQVSGLVVHQRDVVLLLRQLLGDGIAHLAAAYDDDLHLPSSSPNGAAVVSLSMRAAENSAPSTSICPDMYSHSSTTITVAMEPYSTEYCPTCST